MKFQLGNKVMLYPEEKLREIYSSYPRYNKEIIEEDLAYNKPMFNKVLRVTSLALFNEVYCTHGNEEEKIFYEYELILLKH